MTPQDKIVRYLVERGWCPSSMDDIKIVYAPKWFGNRYHCGKRCLRYDVFKNDRLCDLHKNWGKYFTFTVCACPKCSYIVLECDY